MNNLDFYIKFPSVLKKALTNGIVVFENDINIEYPEFSAYRGIIREQGDDTPINFKDFASYMEIGKIVRGKAPNPTKIGSYSCSLNLDTENLKNALKLPKPNKKVIYGPVNCTYGPQQTERESKHVHWWLYKDVDFYDKFEVIF